MPYTLRKSITGKNTPNTSELSFLKAQRQLALLFSKDNPPQPSELSESCINCKNQRIHFHPSVTRLFYHKEYDNAIFFENFTILLLTIMPK